MDELDEGNISTVASVDLIHLSYLNDDIGSSRKTRQIMKKAELNCATLGLRFNHNLEEVIEEDEFNEVNICFTMKVR